MFKYRLFWEDGSDAGEVAYATNPGTHPFTGPPASSVVSP
jgi:hypothetical protein